VVEVPLSALAQFQQMPESRQVGVYFLVSDAEDGKRSSVYIGQTGSLGKRLNEHHLDPKRAYWNRALVAVSLTQSLTQTHALYLEWQSILQSNLAARYLVLNGNAGSKPHTPPWLEADCQEIFETMRTLVATMGQPVFEPFKLPEEKVTKDDVFYCKSANYEAVAEYTDEGIVVLKGSKARIDIAPSMVGTSAGTRRQALIDDGRLLLDGNFYVFQEDVLFRSPSGASDVVVGASSNGWLNWRSATGQTLDALKRQAPATV
jgi:predicted GIY-YIG superfamily endonuclease